MLWSTLDRPQGTPQPHVWSPPHLPGPEAVVSEEERLHRLLLIQRHRGSSHQVRRPPGPEDLQAQEAVLEAPRTQHASRGKRHVPERRFRAECLKRACMREGVLPWLRLLILAAGCRLRVFVFLCTLRQLGRMRTGATVMQSDQLDDKRTMYAMSTSPFPKLEENRPCRTGRTSPHTAETPVPSESAPWWRPSPARTSNRCH